MVRVNFEATEDLQAAVKHLAIDLKRTSKDLWIQAMQEFLEREAR